MACYSDAVFFCLNTSCPHNILVGGYVACYSDALYFCLNAPCPHHVFVDGYVAVIDADCRVEGLCMGCNDLCHVACTALQIPRSKCGLSTLALLAIAHISS